MELSKLQQKIVETNEDKVVVISAAASGKALGNNELLYTQTGPIRICEARIGTKIYGEDGKLHTITAIYPQGKKRKYIVRFSDRTEIECCDEHLWTYQTESLRGKKSKTWKTNTLREIIDNVPLHKSARTKNNFGTKETMRRNIFIPMCAPIEFEEKVLPIDPYTFGALLGDGSFRVSNFTNMDEDVIQRVRSGIEKIGCTLDYDCRYEYNIHSGGRHIFSKILKELNLWQVKSEKKFIPTIYKFSSIEQRLELIKGIIDTDGSCRGSHYDITLKSKQLILDIKEICESLGLTAVYSEKKAICTNSSKEKKDCGKVYRLYIKTSREIQRLHFSQRREKQWRPTKVYAYRAIEEIIETNEWIEMTCITIDNPTALFVTSSFIVTHNTQVITNRIIYLLEHGADPSKIVMITFTNMAAEEMRKRIGEKSNGVFIGTIHSYANYLLLSYGIDTSKLIETEKFEKFFPLIKKNIDCIKPIDYLLLDEAQDSTADQFEFMLDMINPKSFFLVGDTRQSIYGFNEACPQYLIKLTKDPSVKTYSLNENYRNAPAILNFAKGIINKISNDDSIPMRKDYQGLVKQASFSIAQIINILKKQVRYDNWFFLCRWNKQIDEVCMYLEKNNIPYTTFKKSQLTKNELDERMKENSIKVLTIHTAKGLEADNVIVYGSQWKTAEEIRVNYVAATRAKNLLIWMNKVNRINKMESWE